MAKRIKSCSKIIYKINCDSNKRRLNFSMNSHYSSSIDTLTSVPEARRGVGQLGENEIVLFCNDEKLSISVSNRNRFELFTAELRDPAEIQRLTGSFLSTPRELFEALSDAIGERSREQKTDASGSREQKTDASSSREQKTDASSSLVFFPDRQLLLHRSRPFNKEFLISINLQKVTCVLEERFAALSRSTDENSKRLAALEGQLGQYKMEDVVSSIRILSTQVVQQNKSLTELKSLTNQELLRLEQSFASKMSSFQEKWTASVDSAEQRLAVLDSRLSVLLERGERSLLSETFAAQTYSCHSNIQVTCSGRTATKTNAQNWEGIMGTRSFPARGKHSFSVRILNTQHSMIIIGVALEGTERTGQTGGISAKPTAWMLHCAFGTLYCAGSARPHLMPMPSQSIQTMQTIYSMQTAQPIQTIQPIQPIQSIQSVQTDSTRCPPVRTGDLVTVTVDMNRLLLSFKVNWLPAGPHVPISLSLTGSAALCPSANGSAPPATEQSGQTEPTAQPSNGTAGLTALTASSPLHSKLLPAVDLFAINDAVQFV